MDEFDLNFIILPVLDAFGFLFDRFDCLASLAGARLVGVSHYVMPDLRDVNLSSTIICSPVERPSLRPLQDEFARAPMTNRLAPNRKEVLPAASLALMMKPDRVLAFNLQPNRSAETTIPAGKSAAAQFVMAVGFRQLIPAWQKGCLLHLSAQWEGGSIVKDYELDSESNREIRLPWPENGRKEVRLKLEHSPEDRAFRCKNPILLVRPRLYGETADEDTERPILRTVRPDAAPDVHGSIPKGGLTADSTAEC